MFFVTFYNKRWSIEIFVEDDDGGPGGYVEVPLPRWLPLTSTGYQKVNFVIDSGFFEDNKSYLLQLRASRNPTFENPGK